MMDVATLICILAAVAFGYFWWNTANRKRNLPPGPFYVLPNYIRDLIQQPSKFVKLGEKYGGMCTLPTVGKNMILLTNWESMTELINGNDAFSDKPEIFFYLDNELKNLEMITASGPTNREKRRFVLYQLRNLGFGKSSTDTIMLEEISQLIAILDKSDGQEVQISKLFHLSILNILWGITAGKSFDYEDDNMKQYIQILEDKYRLVLKAIYVNIMPILRFLPGDLFHFWELHKKLLKEDAYFNCEIQEHAKSFQQDTPRDFIDIYLDKIYKQSEKDQPKETCFTVLHLKGALFSLFNAGIETTSTTLEWAMIYFVTWPEIQQKVQTELDSVIGRHRKPTVQDRPLLPYTEATVMEIQRYATIIPTTLHKSSKATQVMGYTFPKGTELIRSIYAIHHNKSLWGDPEVFRPERFIKDGKVFKPEYFIPFSNGQRQCIAEHMTRMELFLFVASLLQHFTFSYKSGTKPPSLEPIITLMAKPQNYSILVKRRMD